MHSLYRISVLGPLLICGRIPWPDEQSTSVLLCRSTNISNFPQQRRTFRWVRTPCFLSSLLTCSAGGSIPLLCLTCTLMKNIGGNFLDILGNWERIECTSYLTTKNPIISWNALLFMFLVLGVRLCSPFATLHPLQFFFFSKNVRHDFTLFCTNFYNKNFPCIFYFFSTIYSIWPSPEL